MAMRRTAAVGKEVCAPYWRLHPVRPWIAAAGIPSQRQIWGNRKSSPPCVDRRVFSSASLRSQLLYVQVPQLAESISEGTVASFTKAVGDLVEADEEIASIETDKIDVSINAPQAGSIVELLVAEGDTVTVGQQVASVDTQSVQEQVPPKSSVSKAECKTVKSSDLAPSKPAVRKESHYESPNTKGDSAAATSPTHLPTLAPFSSSENTFSATDLPLRPASGPSRVEREEKMTRIRKTIATRLKRSQNICASLTTMQEVDMSNLMIWRAKHKAGVFDTQGIRLGYMGAFTKATSLAAQAVPAINGAIDIDREVVTYRDYVDVSIAVSTPKGLVTPVLRNCESLSIIELEREIAMMAAKGRTAKLTMDDLQGGNYTISNPGIFGSMFGTPLINYPQAAVFNMNTIKDRVVVHNGEMAIRPMMYISLTYDHRLIDGREAVTFLGMVRQYIEDPAAMIL